ncbi:hypothetical protein DDW09_04565 [Sulfolobus sp. SCGC AB-777_L09]|nr:hypothetical protein DDW09_04565 [Sulfolobus sp. SCGC AB-777_L09]
MRFINYSFAYWRRKNKVTMVRGEDPFSFSSEVQGIISDPSPFFTKLLINASKVKEIRNVKEKPRSYEIRQMASYVSLLR